MPEISDVAPGGDVLATWGNAIRDRAVMRYTSEAARDASDPSPDDGQLCWIEDIDELQARVAGVWRSVAVVVGLFDNGDAASPTYSFANDADTGMFRYAANQIGFTAGGVLQMFTGNGANPGINAADGTLTRPGFRFSRAVELALVEQSGSQCFSCGKLRVVRQHRAGRAHDRKVSLRDVQRRVGYEDVGIVPAHLSGRGPVSSQGQGI